MREVRLKVGVVRFPDGWDVVIEADGERAVYDPTFDTEAEAEAKAKEVSAVIRQTFGGR